MNLLKKLREEINRQVAGNANRGNTTVKFAVLIRVYILIIGLHRLINGISLLMFKQWLPGTVSLVFFALNYLLFQFSYTKSRRFVKNLYTLLSLIWVVLIVVIAGWNIGAQHFLFSLMVFWVVTGDESIRKKSMAGFGFCVTRLILYLYVQSHKPLCYLNETVATGEQFLNTIFIFASILFLTTVFCRETILTEEENSRKALQLAYQRAEQANRAKTDFLSSMSHDIRTPLNAIVGTIALAKRRSEDIAYLRDSMYRIGTASNQLLTLVNDILDISKIESGELALNEEPFSIREFVDRTTSIIMPTIDEKNHTFSVNMHDISHDQLCIDRLRLSQICLNLLSNAVKYTEPGGDIKLEVYEENLLNSEEQVRLVLAVQDSGIGISKEYQEQMYASFSRSTDSRINQLQGSGLGLSISKQLVELMGGEILCDSEVGKGTTFTVKIVLTSLPNVRSREQAHTVSDTKALRGLHLLVVEDNTINWHIARELLEDEGITTERAENGQQCLDILDAAKINHFDAILMDVEMPVMNGKETTRHIRSSDISWIRNIPVIATTANAFAEDVRDCLDAGMNDHISKPIDVEVLRKKLMKIRQK